MQKTKPVWNLNLCDGMELEFMREWQSAGKVKRYSGHSMRHLGTGLVLLLLLLWDWIATWGRHINQW